MLPLPSRLEPGLFLVLGTSFTPRPDRLELFWRAEQPRNKLLGLFNLSRLALRQPLIPSTFLRPLLSALFSLSRV